MRGKIITVDIKLKDVKEVKEHIEMQDKIIQDLVDTLKEYNHGAEGPKLAREKLTQYNLLEES